LPLRLRFAPLALRLAAIAIRAASSAAVIIAVAAVAAVVAAATNGPPVLTDDENRKPRAKMLAAFFVSWGQFTTRGVSQGEVGTDVVLRVALAYAAGYEGELFRW
jgi:hypothetical protein